MSLHCSIVHLYSNKAFTLFVVFHTCAVLPIRSREKGARASGMVDAMATSHTGFSPPSDPNESNSRSRTSPDEEFPRFGGGHGAKFQPCLL